MQKLSILVFLFLFGCKSIETNRIAPGYTEAFRTINIALFGYPDDQISTEVINNIPYASAFLKIGKGPRGLMILESKKQSLETWVSGDGVKIFVDSGRVIRTTGLTNNLVNYILPKSNKIIPGINTRFKSYRSFDKPQLLNLELQITLSSKGKELVGFHDREEILELIEEEIINTKIGWKRVNKYWLDDDGYIWMSEQYISPKLPKFVIQVTKKPS